MQCTVQCTMQCPMQYTVQCTMQCTYRHVRYLKYWLMRRLVVLSVCVLLVGNIAGIGLSFLQACVQSRIGRLDVILWLSC